MGIEFLSNLKVGDKVVVYTNFCDDQILEVVRLTKTQILVGKEEMRFSKKDGMLVGGGAWSTTHIREAEEKEVEKILYNQEVKKLLKKLHSINFNTLPLSKIKKILNLVSKEVEDEIKN